MNRVINDLYNHEFAQTLDTSINLGAALSCNFNSTGQVLYVGTGSGEVIIFDTNTKFPLARFPAVDGGIVAISSTIDQEWLVSATTKGIITRYHIPSLSVDCQISFPSLILWAQVCPCNKDIVIVTPPSPLPTSIINIAMEKRHYSTPLLPQENHLRPYEYSIWLNSMPSRSNLSFIPWLIDPRSKLEPGHPLLYAYPYPHRMSNFPNHHLPEGFTTPLHDMNTNKNSTSSSASTAARTKVTAKSKALATTTQPPTLAYTPEMTAVPPIPRNLRPENYTPARMASAAISAMNKQQYVNFAIFSPLGDKIAFGTSHGTGYIADVTFLPNLNPNPPPRFSTVANGSIPGVPIVLERPGEGPNNRNNNLLFNPNDVNVQPNASVTTQPPSYPPISDNPSLQRAHQSLKELDRFDAHGDLSQTNTQALTQRRRGELDEETLLLNTSPYLRDFIAIFPNGFTLSKIMSCTPPQPRLKNRVDWSPITQIQFSSENGLHFGPSTTDPLVVMCFSDGKTITYNATTGSPVASFNMDMFPVPQVEEEDSEHDSSDSGSESESEDEKIFEPQPLWSRVNGAKKAVFAPTCKHLYMMGYCDNHNIAISTLTRTLPESNEPNDRDVVSCQKLIPISDPNFTRYLHGPPSEACFDICAHPFLPLIVTIPSTGRVLFWSTRSKETWTAFNPVFQALEDNLEYLEIETDFDLSIIPTHQGHVQKQFGLDGHLGIVNFNPGYEDKPIKIINDGTDTQKEQNGLPPLDPDLVGFQRVGPPVPAKLMFYYRPTADPRTNTPRLQLETKMVQSDPVLARPRISHHLTTDFFLTNLVTANLTHRLDDLISNPIINRAPHHGIGINQRWSGGLGPGLSMQATANQLIAHSDAILRADGIDSVPLRRDLTQDDKNKTDSNSNEVVVAAVSKPTKKQRGVKRSIPQPNPPQEHPVVDAAATAALLDLLGETGTNLDDLDQLYDYPTLLEQFEECALNWYTKYKTPLPLDELTPLIDPTSGFFLPPATTLHFLNNHIIPVLESRRKTGKLPPHLYFDQLISSPHTSVPVDPLLLATATSLSASAKLTPFHHVTAQNNVVSGMGAAASADVGMNPFNRLDSHTTLGRGAGHEQLSNPIYTLQHISVKKVLAITYPMVHGPGILKDPYVSFHPGKE